MDSEQYYHRIPTVMDKQLDVLHCHPDGNGILLGASCLTGRYWLGSLWFYQSAQHAPNVEMCTAGVQLEAGVGDAQWVDGRSVLVGLDTGGVALWSLEGEDYSTFTQAQSATGHDNVVISLSVLCDRSKAVSAGHDRCIKLWDLPSVSLLYNAQAHLDMINSIDCHPSEPDLFVSCGTDDRILLWDKRKSKPASILSKSPLQQCATCVRWQPGQLHKLAIGSESGEIVMIDTRAGVERSKPHRPHNRPVYDMAFCASKPSLLASVGEDCRSVVTSVQDDSLQEIYSDTTHTDFAHGLAWSGESSIFTCGWDGCVLSHDLASGIATALGQVEEKVNQTKTNGDVSKMNGDRGDHNMNGDCNMKSAEKSNCKSFSEALSSTPVASEG